MEQNEKKPLIILTGPTAVGKTELSIELAKAVNGEILSRRFHASIPWHGHRHSQNQKRRDAGDSSLYDRRTGSGRRI